MPPYDAFLLVSFGGPEGPDEVIPFLRNVTSGRNVPPERLEQVAEHYYRFGGVSPINQQCRDLVAAIEKDFAAAGIALPVYWGNRNWDPYLADTVLAMAADGVRHALAFVTSAYSSYSSCRQYLDDIELARAQAGRPPRGSTRSGSSSTIPALSSRWRRAPGGPSSRWGFPFRIMQILSLPRTASRRAWRPQAAPAAAARTRRS